jgi:hypothetical protein
MSAVAMLPTIVITRPAARDAVEHADRPRFEL